MEKKEVLLYKLDDKGYFLEYESKEVEVNTEEGIADIKNIPEGYASFGWMQQNPKQRWFRPRWDFAQNKWVEDATEEEIQEHDHRLKVESKPKEELEELQKQLKELQQSNAELMNLISMQSIAPK